MEYLKDYHGYTPRAPIKDTICTYILDLLLYSCFNDPDGNKIHINEMDLWVK